MMTDPSGRPTTLRLVLEFAAQLVAVLVVLFAIDLAGFADAGDAVLRRGFYDLRGQRDSTQRVVLVAIDNPTLASWGAPPWKADKIDPLFAAIERGKPVAVGLVEDSDRVLAPGTKVAAVTGPTQIGVTRNAVETLPLKVGDTDEATVDAKIAAAAGLSVTSSIAINYVGPRGLPMVSALDVAAGRMPPSAFAGKIVVVGFTADRLVSPLPTPIGALAPAKVHAHALASITDGASWSTVPGWLRWLVIAVACSLTIILITRFGSIGATVASVAIVGALVGVDYLMFSSGSVQLGATLLVVGSLLSATAVRIRERVVLRHHVHEIGRRARQWMTLETMRTDAIEDPGYWPRVGELARLYLGCTSSIVAELPIDKSELVFSVFHETNDALVSERRRDVRRSPWRKAHMTLGPVWHDRFMIGDSATLIVPLVARTQLIGFWIVNFPKREMVEQAHMTLVQMLAHEIAMAIDRRRFKPTAKPSSVVGKLLGGGNFSIDVHEVRNALQTHARNQEDLLALGESMPFGVFVATLWGEIRYMNTAMKLACKQENIEVSSGNASLSVVLSGLSGFPTDDIHRHLRALVQQLEELHLRGRDRGDRPGTDFVLSWLKSGGANEPTAEQLIVVCALPRRQRKQAAPVVHNTSSLTQSLANAAMTGELVLPLVAKPPVEDHAVTRRVDKFDKIDQFDKIDMVDKRNHHEQHKVDEDAGTVPVEKLDFANLETREYGSTNGTNGTSGSNGIRAQGTPRPGGLPSVLLDNKTPFVPDATLALAKEPKRAEDEYYDEVMFVSPGMTGRLSQRRLPVIAGGEIGNKNNETMPLFKFSKLDDQH